MYLKFLITIHYCIIWFGKRCFTTSKQVSQWLLYQKSNSLHLWYLSRAALLFAHGDLKWDKFHILISRSTTPDLMKIVSKLDEFIMQQFTSSKRALGAMGPITASVRQKLHEKHKSGDEDSCKYLSRSIAKLQNSGWLKTKSTRYSSLIIITLFLLCQCACTCVVIGNFCKVLNVQLLDRKSAVFEDNRLIRFLNLFSGKSYKFQRFYIKNCNLLVSLWRRS